MIGSISTPSYNNYNVQGVFSKPSAKQAENIEFSYNSQDQLVKSAGTTEVDGVTISKGLKGSTLSTERTKLANFVRNDFAGLTGVKNH